MKARIICQAFNFIKATIYFPNQIKLLHTNKTENTQCKFCVRTFQFTINFAVPDFSDPTLLHELNIFY